MPVQVAFDTNLKSSDGGGLLLTAVDRKLGLVAALASCCIDRLDPARIHRSSLELVWQGMSSRAISFVDSNDAALLGAATKCCRRPTAPATRLAEGPGSAPPGPSASPDRMPGSPARTLKDFGTGLGGRSLYSTRSNRVDLHHQDWTENGSTSPVDPPSTIFLRPELPRSPFVVPPPGRSA